MLVFIPTKTNKQKAKIRIMDFFYLQIYPKGHMNFILLTYSPFGGQLCSEVITSFQALRYLV